MIALLGYGSESVFQYAAEKLAKRIDGVTVIDVEDYIYDENCHFEMQGDVLLLEGRERIELAAHTPIYHRFFYRQEADAEAAGRLSKLYRTFVRRSIAIDSGTLLINNPLAGALNSSKPAQLSSLKSLGFRVPETIVSLDGRVLRDFVRRYDRVISKGASSIRTIADIVESADLGSIGNRYSWPVMLQQFIGGYDVRLHQVGLRSIALKIETDHPDYRYAERNGVPIHYGPIEVPPEIFQLCWKYMKTEKQEFVAFDFRVENDVWYLLEANPMPGYSFFDRMCEEQISDALAALLSQGYSNLCTFESHRGFLPPARRPAVDMGAIR